MALSFRFGTVGSPIGTPKPGGSPNAIKFSASIGLTCLELGWVQSVRVSEETCALIKATAAESGVALSIHAPYFINLNANSEEWPKSRKRLMDAAHYGNLAGATDIIFHPGSYFGDEPSKVLQVAIPRLKECAEELASAGNTVHLRPETMGKSAMLGSLEDTIEMAEKVGGVLPCIDFAHLHARPGDGTMNSEEEWSHRLEYMTSRLGKDSIQKLHIHLSGIEYGAKGEKNHLPVAESDLNMVGLFTALYKYGAGGRIMCESPIMEADALLMKKTWQQVSGQVE